MIPDTNVGGKVATLDNPFGCGKKVRLPMETSIFTDGLSMFAFV
jgi:hypothetical protein